MVLSSPLRIAVFGAALLALASGAAFAVEAPDRARLEALRTAVHDWPRVRVTTAAASFEFFGVALDSAGVLRDRPQRRAALLATPAGVANPRHIPWAEIERIEGARSRGGGQVAQGVLVGGMVGLAAFFIVMANDEGESGPATSAIPLGMFLGGMLGASAGRTRWVTLYP